MVSYLHQKIKLIKEKDSQKLKIKAIGLGLPVGALLGHLVEAFLTGDSQLEDNKSISTKLKE